MFMACKTANYGACEPDDAIPILVSNAERGDIEAACRLRWHYEYCEEDEKQAAYWLRKGVTLGDAQSQWDLSYKLLNQNLAPSTKDIAEGMELLKKAAEQDDHTAQNVLGDYYRDGKFVPADWKQSEYWYRRSANNGDTIGMKKLADLLTRKSNNLSELIESYKWSVILTYRTGTYYSQFVKRQQDTINEKAEKLKINVSLLKRKAEAQAAIDNKRIPHYVFESPTCKKNAKN